MLQSSKFGTVFCSNQIHESCMCGPLKAVVCRPRSYHGIHLQKSKGLHTPADEPLSSCQSTYTLNGPDSSNKHGWHSNTAWKFKFTDIPVSKTNMAFIDLMQSSWIGYVMISLNMATRCIMYALNPNWQTIIRKSKRSSYDCAKVAGQATMKVARFERSDTMYHA